MQTEPLSCCKEISAVAAATALELHFAASPESITRSERRRCRWRYPAYRVAFDWTLAIGNDDRTSEMANELFVTFFHRNLFSNFLLIFLKFFFMFFFEIFYFFFQISIKTFFLFFIVFFFNCIPFWNIFFSISMQFTQNIVKTLVILAASSPDPL